MPTAGVQTLGAARPQVQGKFLVVGQQKLFVRGVTYGPFRPDASGCEYPDRALVNRDFALMAANAVNALRTYTVPPRWLLDAAQCHGLRVMVGLSWEDHVAFLERGALAKEIVQRVREGVRSCGRHPALLAYAVANEIPAPIVRWHGVSRIERFLRTLAEVAKEEDPEGLVTYVNYPTTEYLRLQDFDFLAFNVYLEERERLASYLKRLQILAGDRPLLLAEAGLDSRRNGEPRQAEVLDWQIRTAFEAGCGGAFVFAWTDEWHRGGHDIEDWDFGLVTRNRQPKAALAAVGGTFSAGPFGSVKPWPRVSVVVCSHNGARTIEETLTHLARLDYPDYETIVVDDGSSDATADIARRFDVRLISTENRGLSNARNTGLAAATGEIVAYIDDDAYPDPHWLRYLVLTFQRTDHVGVGGPNLAPPGDGPLAECIDNAPGNPTHILIGDDLAEHVPGCNMAFRRSALLAVGGFDPRFRATADDVDLCWRLQDQGGTIGFSPAAVTWHHRRASIRQYLRQQYGYGRGEALLEQKWPARHSPLGHLTWCGRIYGRGLTEAIRLGPRRVYHGIWGSALFQSLYERGPTRWSSLPLMPEWYLVIALLAGLSLLGFSWRPMVIFALLALGALAVSLLQAGMSASKATFQTAPRGAYQWGLHALTAVLHLLQPIARLCGRLRHGLTPWRHRGWVTAAPPWPRSIVLWDEAWRAAEDRLRDVEARLRAQGAVVRSGSEFDRWDLEVRGGSFGSVRGLLALEEHGSGRQLVRFRLWPRVPGPVLAFAGVFGLLALAAAADGAWVAACVQIVAAAGLLALSTADCAIAMGCWLTAQFASEPQAHAVASEQRQHERLHGSCKPEGGARAPDCKVTHLSC